jgi:hypothetical protein
VPDPDHGNASEVRKPGTGGDDQRVMAGVDQPVDHVAHGVADAVDLGKEGLGHDCDSHASDCGRGR